jgi:hypothetical protein
MRFSIFIGLVLFCSTVTAQTVIVKGPWKYRFGFNLGVNHTSPAITGPAATPYPSDTIDTFVGKGGAGFTMGLSLEKRIRSRVVLTAQPSISFTDFTVSYVHPEGKPSPHVVSEMSLTEIPLMIQYRKCKGRFKPTFAIGPNWKFDVSRQKQLSALSMWSLDMQIGVEKWFGYFSLVPQLKYSIGLTDVPLKSQYTTADAAQSMRLHSISLVLGFRG